MLTLLKYINRLRLGHKPLFVEYEYNFKPRWEESGNPFIKAIFQNNDDQILKNLKSLRDFLPLVKELNSENALSPRINWNNHFIPALDGLSLMWAATRATNKIIEVGSGNSTIFMKRALQFSGSNVELVSIDPYPRVEINSLCDQVIRSPLENIDLSIFDTLQAGDVLFIDNSHRSFMNSDVTVVMLDILPRLKPGVLVGVHDIFLPFDYMKSWANRAYNEQYLLASYLISNPKYFSIELTNYWIWKNQSHIEPLKEIWAILGENVRDRSASAFWAIKN